MTELKTFFRHCPNCGRRFEIHIVSKKIVGQEDEEVEVGGTPNLGQFSGAQGGGQPGSFVDLGLSGRPVEVDVKEFEYSYKCGNCGHMWTELQVKD